MSKPSSSWSKFFRDKMFHLIVLPCTATLAFLIGEMSARFLIGWLYKGDKLYFMPKFCDVIYVEEKAQNALNAAIQ
jgi:hypothetical protein